MSGGGDPSWQPATTGENAKWRAHSARISPRWLGASMNSSTSAIRASLP
jgi:hypothetical protein